MKIAESLIALGLCDRDSVHLFREGTRDCDNIRVFACKKSGVIFLESDDHVTSKHYQNMAGFSYWGSNTRADALRSTRRDDERRAGLIGPLAKDKRWLDIGTGAGGILDLVASTCAEVAAVEPQAAARHALEKEGYTVLASLDDAREAHFDLITLFHVYEHVPDPINFLRSVKRRLAPGGRVYIEVPHARDFLIAFLGCEAFIKFTLWSEHLILHTRESLQHFIAASGFSRCDISGLQRYPLANHLHWLATGKPGGHEKWPMLSGEQLDTAYAAMLARLDYSDTLWACAQA
jgi:2-polyprenyl-3-methyl-5-hydroxy-6-metoxy-1,4-benzoquinol methylase